jgi:hypothetical protein
MGAPRLPEKSLQIRPFPNGVSAREIERKYHLTPKSAWFAVHRIREAMKRKPLAGLLSGRVVADETWIGGAPKNRHGHK